MTSCILIMSVLYSNTYAFVWENAGLDMFKKISEKWASSYQKLIENELKWSAQKINNYIASRDLSLVTYLDTSNDFTKSELDEIVNNWNVTFIYIHLVGSKRKITNTNEIKKLLDLITLWYRTQELETSNIQSSLVKIGSSWLYNDGNLENSGYDLMYDLEQIHNVIFSNKVYYNWQSNNLGLDFANSLVNWDNEISPIYNPESTLADSIQTNSWTNNWSWATNISDIVTNESNKCNTWILLDWLDSNFLKDLERQLDYGNNFGSTTWWEGNTSWDRNNGNNSNRDRLNFSHNWKGYDSFNCDGFICIMIEFINYWDKLAYSINNSIEWILDKHLEIANVYSAKSLVQSTMTKNFFSLSLLKDLNLPSMAHLGIVVTSLPPPILNLEPKNKSTSIWELKFEEILEKTFAENWVDWKTQNNLNPSYEFKNIGNCTYSDTTDCNERLLETINSYQPKIRNTDYYHFTLNNKYRLWLDDNIAELNAFSNTFKNNMEQVIGQIKKLSQKWSKTND